ncbi:MAG: hypothetical protein AAGC82_17570 [Pseudomonadota bacterium]
MVIGSIVGAISGADAADEQSDAANAATRAQEIQFNKALAETRRQYDTSLNFLREGIGDAKGHLATESQRANNALQQYGNQSIGTIQRYNNLAENALRNSTNTALENDARGYSQAQGYLNPYYRSGLGAQGVIDYELGFGEAPANYDGFSLTPGAQFLQEEGERALLRTQAARGGLDSGTTLQDLSRFNQGLAATDYDNYINRLLSVSGTGANAGNALANAALSTANTAGNRLQSLGNNLAGLRSGTGSNVAGIQSGIGAGISNNIFGAGQGMANASLGFGNSAANLATGLGNNIANLGVNFGNQQANNLIQAGNAQATGSINTGNSIISGVNNLASLAGFGFGGGFSPNVSGAPSFGSFF